MRRREIVMSDKICQNSGLLLLPENEETPKYGSVKMMRPKLHATVRYVICALFFE